MSEEGWGQPLTLTQSGSFIWKNMGDEKAEVMSTFQGFKGFNLYTLNSPPFLFHGCSSVPGDDRLRHSLEHLGQRVGPG